MLRRARPLVLWLPWLLCLPTLAIGCRTSRDTPIDTTAADTIAGATAGAAEPAPLPYGMTGHVPRQADTIFTMPLREGVPTVTHFAELPWGATLAAVRTRYPGLQPEDTLWGMITLAGPVPDLFGSKTTGKFFVDSVAGLVMGYYEILSGDSTEAIRHAAERVLRERYATLPLVPHPDAPGTLLWTDPVTGARLSLSADDSRGQPTVTLIYSGPRELHARMEALAAARKKAESDAKSAAAVAESTAAAERRRRAEAEARRRF